MRSSSLIALYGTGGCARGVMPLARKQYPGRSLVFVDDRPRSDTCNGFPVLAFDDLLSHQDAIVAIAVANPQARRSLAFKCSQAGIRFAGVEADDMIAMDDVKWGEGCLFSNRATLTSNIRIGSHFHCNLHSIVEHDCRIGDFVTFAPGVLCNGSVTIGDGAYIGAGAMIRQGITIGQDAVVGMGAVVVKDVLAGAIVAGNPAAPLKHEAKRR